MQTLLLDQKAWDLCKDAGGNIALASEPYAIAQDAASGIKLFSGECWYDTTRGVPYWQKILGKFPPLDVIRSTYVAVGLAVPDVTAAVCYIGGIVNRQLSGQLLLTTSSGATVSVPLA